MNSSIAAVTLIMGVGSDLSSAMKVACHGSGHTASCPRLTRAGTTKTCIADNLQKSLVGGIAQDEAMATKVRFFAPEDAARMPSPPGGVCGGQELRVGRTQDRRTSRRNPR